MVTRVRRWIISKKDKKKLIETIKSLYGIELVNKDDKVEVVVENDTKLFIVNNMPAFIEIGEKIVPHLKLLLRNGYDWLPSIVVDQGAVMPIARGADLMRPGIVRISREFDKGDVVVIVEPSKLLPLAVHEALYSSAEIEEMDKGKVTRSLHHLRDKYWRLAENL